MIPPESVLDQPGGISVFTARRRMSRIRRYGPRLPHRRGCAHSNTLTRNIPMVLILWDEREAGHLETYLVHHCGTTATASRSG